MDALVNLKVLNLSFNAIKSIEALNPLPNLQELYLQSNAIASVDFKSLARKCPKLQVLSFQNADGSASNPICQQSSLYTNSISREFPRLMMLDGQSLQFQQVKATSSSTMEVPVLIQENDLESITTSWKFNWKDQPSIDPDELMKPFRDAIQQCQDEVIQDKFN